MKTAATSIEPDQRRRAREVVLLLGVLNMALGVALTAAAIESIWGAAAFLAALTANVILYGVYALFGGRMIIFHNITGLSFFVCVAVAIWVSSVISEV
ncbi:MAG TPA: hypothetical protein VEA15_06505 [Caulobacteraceae bacterium]|nr:hypothetical protein [Caulobacteraceae bacterium]